TTDVAVDLALHPVEGLLWLARDAPHNKGHLAHGGALWIAQPLRAQRTRPAGAPCAAVWQRLQAFQARLLSLGSARRREQTQGEGDEAPNGTVPHGYFLKAVSRLFFFPYA